MCDYVDGDYSDIWEETTPRARKEYRCCECYAPILKGQKHVHVSSLYDGNWDHFRAHTQCHKLLKYIAFTICDQEMYFFQFAPLRERVREHMHEAPEVLVMYRDAMRANRRAA